MAIDAESTYGSGANADMQAVTSQSSAGAPVQVAAQASGQTPVEAATALQESVGGIASGVVHDLESGDAHTVAMYVLRGAAVIVGVAIALVVYLVVAAVSFNNHLAQVWIPGVIDALPGAVLGVLAAFGLWSAQPPRAPRKTDREPPA